MTVEYVRDGRMIGAVVEGGTPAQRVVARKRVALSTGLRLEIRTAATLKFFRH
jgi:hypothetical protein